MGLSCSKIIQKCWSLQGQFSLEQENIWVENSLFLKPSTWSYLHLDWVNLSLNDRQPFVKGLFPWQRNMLERKTLFTTKHFFPRMPSWDITMLINYYFSYKKLRKTFLKNTLYFCKKVRKCTTFRRYRSSLSSEKKYNMNVL